jgi:malonyl-CoA O-methyltransferase
MVHKEFTRHASTYHDYSTIQKQVAHELLQRITTKPKKILELGSGSGIIYRSLDWSVEQFVGIDFSEGMCQLHPKSSEVTIYHDNFDAFDYSRFEENAFDAIISSSSLQWSNDLAKLLPALQRLSNQHYFAIFTAETFGEIFDFLEIQSPLKPKAYYSTLLKDYQMETLRYQLTFQSRKELFEYIKKSGVSGGEKRISYQEAKKLYLTYPSLTLDFEILLAIKD